MTDENENRPTRAPLTLKPRPGASVSTGTVKQQFSHGRSKTVVVETKRARTGAPPNLAAPSLAEKRSPGFDVRGPAPQRSSASPSQADSHQLSEDERQRRQKVAAEFAARQQADRAAAEARARDAVAARAREEAAARAAEQAAAAAAPAVEPAAAAPEPAAPSRAEAPAGR